jgi:hypothetical protein
MGLDLIPENQPQTTETAVVQQLLDIQQAAGVLHRSHWTLRQDIKKGHIRCLRIGRRILIEPSEIRRLVEEGRQRADSKSTRCSSGSSAGRTAE